MTDVHPKDLGHDVEAPIQGECLGAATIVQFYTFASQCIDWAKTTKSLQERAVYVQMGLQWLAAGARLQTFLQLKDSQRANLPSEGLLEDRSMGTGGRVGNACDK
jgi:hypothetical protein